MKGRRSILVALTASLAMSCALVVGVGEGSMTPASGSTLTCGESWSSVPSDNAVRLPRASTSIAPNDIWIVGNSGFKNSGVETKAEHWDGGSWTLSPTPNRVSSGQNALNGADALTGTDVWSVGYYKHAASEFGGSYKTLIEHWDGTQWEVVDSPNVGTGSNTLTGVDALRFDLAWAVGYSRVSAKDATLRKALIQRWDGTSWSVVPSPNPGTHSNGLLGVRAIDANNVWAVGYKSDGARYRALILHYDGTTWTEVDVPSAGTGDNVLTSISAVDGNDIWATGYYIEGSQYEALTLHYDGTGWTSVPSASPGDGITVHLGADSFSPTDAWAVGFIYRADLNKYVASTQHWDGSAWTTLPSAIATTGTSPSVMFDVAKAPGTAQVWATGLPRNVETICPSETPAAKASPGTSSGTSGASTTSSIQPSNQVEPSLAKPSSSVEKATPSVTTSSAAIPVTAVDKAREAGVYELTRTWGAIVDDFNNDTLPDIFFGRHQDPARLYINDGNGHFTETNTGTFGKIDRHGCDAADVNKDRLLDIFCGIGAALGTNLKQNELYIQQSDYTFVDQAGQYGVLDPLSRGRSGAFINANGDRYPDLFVGNMPDRPDGLPSHNQLLINERGSGYRYSATSGLEREVLAATDHVGDLDKDGWQDLVVVPGGGKPSASTIITRATTSPM